MIQARFKIINWLSFAVLFAICCGVQTSLWYQLTGSSVAPQFWLVIVLYLALNRSYTEAILSAYGLSLIVKGFSAIPIGVVMLTIFISVSLTSFVKSRMFWPTIRYFLIATVAFCLLYNVTYLIISNFTEINSARILLWIRIIDILLTTFFAWPFYFLLLLVDKWTLPEVLDIKDFSHE